MVCGLLGEQGMEKQDEKRSRHKVDEFDKHVKEIALDIAHEEGTSQHGQPEASGDEFDASDRKLPVLEATHFLQDIFLNNGRHGIQTG